jgi:acetoacetyl-CoA synthetase
MKTPLWTPNKDDISSSHMTKFREYVNSRFTLEHHDYDSLYHWSIYNIEDFWESFSDFSGIYYGSPHDAVLRNPVMPGANWFPGAHLNFAQNLLRFRDNHNAITFVKDGGSIEETISYAELYSRVAKMANYLRSIGITKSDRVCAFIPNRIEAIIGMLATTSIGAIWSSCSPDFGYQGVFQRFNQIQPKIILTADGYFYAGKRIESLPLVQQLAENIASIKKIIIVPYLEDHPTLTEFTNFILWQEIMAEKEEELFFTMVPFAHPLFIMYSSGTTGVPKCMVHGTGGTLLQHAKEHLLHCNFKKDDTIFYYTTCGWMMWNWLVSALFTGAHLVLYDGNPFWPDANVLWRMSEELGITVFGTSAKYLSMCMKKDIHPKKDHNLSPLRTVLSTGSPLSTDAFNWVYQEVKSDLHLASISGGTDIISCFILGDPTSPVYAGEIQKRALGMKVHAFSDKGESLLGEKGELVCTAPFPSMPIYFWNDTDNEKYISAYFKTFPGIWLHGDYIEITENNGIIVHGRSDATLNPGGIRLGTTELYCIVEAFDEVEDSIAVAQEWQGDVRIILFVVIGQQQKLTDSLIQEIQSSIRSNLSPHHVPAKIVQVPEIPITINGKKMEIAVTNIIHGKEVKNKGSLANPESLQAFVDLPDLKT